MERPVHDRQVRPTVLTSMIEAMRILSGYSCFNRFNSASMVSKGRSLRSKEGWQEETCVGEEAEKEAARKYATA